jgi:hypothetical protein
MASSLGDVVTLGILAGCAHFLLINIGKPFLTTTKKHSI